MFRLGEEVLLASVRSVTSTAENSTNQHIQIMNTITLPLPPAIPVKPGAIRRVTDKNGNTIGYLTEGISIPIGGSYASLIVAVAAKRRTEEAPAKPAEMVLGTRRTIVYESLPFMSAGECTVCGEYSRTGLWRFEGIETDEGRRNVTHCPECRAMHR